MDIRTFMSRVIEACHSDAVQSQMSVMTGDYSMLPEHKELIAQALNVWNELLFMEKDYSFDRVRVYAFGLTDIESGSPLAQNLYIRIVAMTWLLPDNIQLDKYGWLTSVFRRWIHHENVDLASPEAYLRRITPEQIASLERVFDQAVIKEQIPYVFTDSVLYSALIKAEFITFDEIFNTNRREVPQWDWNNDGWLFRDSHAIRHNPFTRMLDFGFQLYPNGEANDLQYFVLDAKRTVTVPTVGITTFTGFKRWKVQTDNGTEEKHLPFHILEGGLYSILYRAARLQFMAANKDVQLAGSVCPGFWRTMGNHVAFWVLSPLLLLSPLFGFHWVFALLSLPFDVYVLLRLMGFVIRKTKERNARNRYEHSIQERHKEPDTPKTPNAVRIWIRNVAEWSYDVWTKHKSIRLKIAKGIWLLICGFATLTLIRSAIHSGMSEYIGSVANAALFSSLALMVIIEMVTSITSYKPHASLRYIVTGMFAFSALAALWHLFLGEWIMIAFDWISRYFAVIALVAVSVFGAIYSLVYFLTVKTLPAKYDRHLANTIVGLSLSGVLVLGYIALRHTIEYAPEFLQMLLVVCSLPIVFLLFEVFVRLDTKRWEEVEKRILAVEGIIGRYATLVTPVPHTIQSNKWFMRMHETKQAEIIRKVYMLVYESLPHEIRYHSDVAKVAGYIIAPALQHISVSRVKQFQKYQKALHARYHSDSFYREALLTAFNRYPRILAEHLFVPLVKSGNIDACIDGFVGETQYVVAMDKEVREQQRIAASQVSLARVQRQQRWGRVVNKVKEGLSKVWEYFCAPFRWSYEFFKGMGKFVYMLFSKFCPLNTPQRPTVLRSYKKEP